MLLGEKVFTAQDNQFFARLSGDCNPMHVDAVAARRLLSGRQVVHGIHTLLHALNLWRPESGTVLQGVSCTFSNTVNVGDPVIFSQHDDGNERTIITAAVDGLDCSKIEIHSAGWPGAAPPAAGAADTTRAKRHIPALATPLDEAPGSQTGQPMRLENAQAADALDMLQTNFPQAAVRLGVQRLSAIAQMSYLVGMVCPGLHSVYSSLQFSLPAAAPQNEGLTYEVRKYDRRFRLFVIDFRGVLDGEIWAFLRPPPQPQPSTREVAAHVLPGEFKGQRALIIGGSRGLGETTAKLLAAGGADVVITFAAGRNDALAVAEDIRAHGTGSCEVAPLDLKDDFPAHFAVDAASLGSVYFFSTPRIFAKHTELFDRRTFDEFVSLYLHRFYQLCTWLNQTERQTPVKVYLPSTVFITERPKGMTEYAMAKAAAEVLADDLNSSLANVKIIHTRLPRLATDQTSSILKLSVESNVDALLPVVRAMSA